MFEGFSGRKNTDEISHGIDDEKIAAIHRYLGENHNIDREEQLDGGATLFPVDGFSADVIEQIIEDIEDIVGERYYVAAVTIQTADGDVQYIRVSETDGI